MSRLARVTRTFFVDEIRPWSAELPVSAVWSRINSMLDREPAAPLLEDAREWFDGG